jgi:hypothetical protein
MQVLLQGGSPGKFSSQEREQRWKRHWKKGQADQVNEKMNNNERTNERTNKIVALVLSPLMLQSPLALSL